jgi:hypothetical protein
LSAQTSLDSFRQAGFYTIKLQQPLNTRAIIINTNFHTGANLWNKLGGDDIAGMRVFMNATLAEVRPLHIEAIPVLTFSVV